MSVAVTAENRTGEISSFANGTVPAHVSLMERMKDTFELIGLTIDAVGVAVILIGFVIAGIRAARRFSEGDVYRVFRHGLGSAILLGLEFMVAGDIVRTVAVEPNLESVVVLIGIVFIRTFLSFALQLELEGRWPWKKKPVATAT